MHTKSFYCLLGAMLVCAAAAAHAQEADSRDLADRMDRLEHDLMILQRQAAQNGSESHEGEGAANAPLLGSDNSAAASVQVSTLEDEIRTLRGRVEENEFQNKQLADKLAKLQQDTEFRLNELAAASAKAAEPKTPAPKEPKESEEAPTKTAADESDASSDTPRDLYNNAFRLLNQTRYDDAAAGFKQFTAKYPKDPLIGNAWYWLGETWYIRHDYVQAADDFRAGFESLPNGPKAADNLLKLSISLSAMHKTKDACTVLDQLLVKFKDTSASTVQKAQAERMRLNCK